MRTLTHRRSRVALGAGAITLLAALAVATLPAQAATARAELGTSTGTGLAADQTAGTGATERRAAGTGTLQAIKARSAAEIARRQASLAAQLSMVTGGSPALTAADRQALTTLITNDQAGLAALGSKIAADTDPATAKADHQLIFTGYRVYALALPQVRLVRANDALINTALPRLTDAQSRLQAALAKAGKTDQAAAKMADLQAQIDTIRTNTSGRSAMILALTPAQWNADRTVLAPSRQSLTSSRTALKKARADIVAVRAMVQS